MKIEQEKSENRFGICQGAIEGVIFVNGRPQIERADMPLTLSFESIEELERFCRAAKSRGQDRH